MVTVGDKIAWWCLDHLPRKKASSIINQRARKTSVPADTYNPFQRRRRTSESNVAVISPGKRNFGILQVQFYGQNLTLGWTWSERFTTIF